MENTIGPIVTLDVVIFSRSAGASTSSPQNIIFFVFMRHILT